MAKSKNDGDIPATTATIATPAADEWGIPDWREPLNYGDVKRWTFYQWRWEFLRRRDDIRDCFIANANSSQKKWVDCHEQPFGTMMHTRWWVYAEKAGGILEPLLPHERGFVALISPEQAESFNLAYLPNPRFSDQPEELIAPLSDDGTVTVLDGLTAFRLTDFLKLAKLKVKDLYQLALSDFLNQSLVPIQRNEFAVVFDLERPLGPQLEVAKRNLKDLQTDRLGKAMQQRRHPKKWLAYLRTLDAREEGASWSEISALHQNTAGTEQTARDIWKAASALRFNF